jgi:hypothetical protein
MYGTERKGGEREEEDETGDGKGDSEGYHCTVFVKCKRVYRGADL